MTQSIASTVLRLVFIKFIFMESYIFFVVDVFFYNYPMESVLFLNEASSTHPQDQNIECFSIIA